MSWRTINPTLTAKTGRQGRCLLSGNGIGIKECAGQCAKRRPPGAIGHKSEPIRAGRTFALWERPLMKQRREEEGGRDG